MPIFKAAQFICDSFFPLALLSSKASVWTPAVIGDRLAAPIQPMSLMWTELIEGHISLYGHATAHSEHTAIEGALAQKLKISLSEALARGKLMTQLVALSWRDILHLGPSPWGR